LADQLFQNYSELGQVRKGEGGLLGLVGLEQDF